MFTKIDEFELKFPDNKTTAGNDNVFNMATITYGHTINYARVAAADDIIYAIASDASTTQIKYTWYRTNTAGEKGAIISETEYLSVADSTDTSGSGKNYYIITANVLNNNSSENKNYNEYRFYGQKLVIYKAKISPTIKLEADPIKYGIDVKEALSKVVKDDDGINSVNNTMKVYYTFTWNEAASTKNITQALNYPYLNVPEIETTYAVQITIYKANNNGTLAVDNKSEGIIDDINYESNGIFTFDANNELIFAKLTINRIEQDFYVKVGGVALPMSLINLTEALINDNDNVNKEEKVNFKINATENDTSDNDIEVETSYSAQKSTFFVINIYSTGVVKTGLNSNPNALNRTLKPIFEKFYLGNPFSISVNTNSVEKIGEDWYTKFTIRVDINPYVATTAQIAKFSFSQMESEENNGNVIGGNYNAKSWDGETTNAYNPFTIYLKIYKDAPGLSSDKLKNPDNVYDKNTYQYLIFYGDELSIGVTGVVSIKEGDSRKYISLAVDNNVKKLKGIREGVAELNYIEEGNVVPSDLGGAYVEINIDFCVLIRKKAASITVTISHNSFVYGDKFKIKNTTVEPNFTPSGDFIDGDLQNASIVYSIFVTNQPTPDEFSTDSVYGAGSYNLGVYEITNFVILEYGAEEERFNKLDNYKISFAICQIEINKKDVNMQIVEVTNSYNKSEILNTGTVTYMTYRIPYSDAYQIEDIKWIKFAISYDGFVGADTIDSLIAADKYPSIYIASTDSEGVNIVPAGRSPNVGTYKLYKHEYVDAELENYNLIFQDGLHSFIVDPVSVDLRFLIDNEGNEMENSIVSNFNDTAQDFKNYFRLYGVTESAPTPRGTIKINYSKVEGVWLSSVKAAGTYDVKIEYTVATGIDNYMATEKIYSESVIILAIDPTIVIPSYSNVYTGSAINYVVTVEGVGSDIPALKDITVTYSQNGKEYVSDKPMKAGSYYVKVVYAPPVDANYCPIDATTQTAVINITKANVSITNEESLNTQYSANYLLSSQFKIIATGVGEDLEKGAFSSSYLKYEFRRPTEDNWVLWVDNKNTPIDVGSYEVKVTYLSSLNSEISDNYLETEKIFRNNALVIMPKMLESISLSSTFKKIEGVYDGERKEIKVNDTNIKITTGISQSNDTIIPSIPNIDNIVVSYARVSFTIDVNGMKNYAIGAYSINAPINVGSYVLKFTYNANSGENYAYYPGIDIDLENTTEQELLDAVVITITLATPTITLKNTKLPYNAKAQPITAYSAVGVKNEKPVGSYSITYQNANTTGGVWSEKAPMEIGEYNVKVSFYALTGGNYSNAEEVFVGRFAIIKGNLSVILTDRTYNFTGRSIEKANPTVIVPGGASIDMELVTIKYRVHNATEWIAPGVLPYASGYYDVFIFVQETDIYVEYSKIFENSIRVLNIAPNFTVQKYTKIYNAVALDFPSSNITLINSSAGNTQADQAMGATNELTGYFLFRYTVDGAVWTENTPLNSGVYSIRIIYFEGINDNFSTIETIAFNAVYEITPRILEVVPIAGSKVYDKKTIDGSSIEFGFSSQESSPLDDIVPTGSLYAGSAVTTGNYAIELGTLSYGYNYVLTKTATIVYYSILKKEVLPIFETAEYVYDGTPKAPKVSPSSGDILSSDTPNDVRMEVTYATDTISSGTFRAYASIDPVSNYKIADGAVAYKEYVIEKATMTGNLFGESLTSDKLGRETVAKYNSSFHDMVLIKVEPGASVVYSPRQTAYVEIGSYEITATVTKPNYKDEVITATLRIIKGEHTIDIKVAERVLYFADPLPRLITSAPGIVSLDITQSLLPEISEYRWTFTPDDSTHFVEQKGVIELKVERALPKAIVNGNLDRTSNDTSAILVDVAVGNQIIQTISNVFFADASGTRYSQVPTTPGVYTLVVEIAGNDLVSDNTCTYIITVNKERNVTWFYYVIGAAFAILVVAIIIVSKRNKMVIR
ncbi:MAG: hypothetical protein LBU04_00860 [Christensenellaceae bacterium]|nr:hypothetical protein [Christensenellaceae bacterium]